MMRSVSNAVVELDQSSISIKSFNQITYMNDILLPARIMIVTIWIETFMYRV